MRRRRREYSSLALVVLMLVVSSEAAAAAEAASLIDGFKEAVERTGDWFKTGSNWLRGRFKGRTKAGLDSKAKFDKFYRFLKWCLINMTFSSENPWVICVRKNWKQCTNKHGLWKMTLMFCPHIVWFRCDSIQMPLPMYLLGYRTVFYPPITDLGRKNMTRTRLQSLGLD